MRFDLLIMQRVELQSEMELKDCACIRVFDEFLFAMPGDAMEEFLVIHVEVDVLLF